MNALAAYLSIGSALWLLADHLSSGTSSAYRAARANGLGFARTAAVISVILIVAFWPAFFGSVVVVAVYRTLCRQRPT